MAQRPQHQERFAALDGLRGIAILLVLVHHDIQLSPLLDGPPGSRVSYVRAALGFTSSGVDLFFVLSGFLIGGILLDHRDSPTLLRAFYLRRFFRIAPLAWLNLLLGLGWLLLVTGRAHSEIPWIYGWLFAVNVFFAGTDGWRMSALTSHWSLGIEEQFYLIFPWLVRAWPRRHMLRLGALLLGIAVVTRWVILGLFPGHSFAAFMLPFCRADSLGAGFCVAVLLRSEAWPRYNRAERGKLWILWGALGLILAVLLRDLHRFPDEMEYGGLTVMALFCGVSLMLAIDPRESWLKACLTNRFVRMYGRFSFFIYLFQLPFNQLFSLLLRRLNFLPPGAHWLEPIAQIFLILLPAAISWRYFESPLLALGRKWKYEPEAASLPVASNPIG